MATKSSTRASASTSTDTSKNSAPMPAQWAQPTSGAEPLDLSGRHQSPSRYEAGTGGGHERLARALGWFSIGLGLAEVVAPRRLARLIGVNEQGQTVRVLRAMGVRELTHGVGILSRRRPTGWVWSRVAGDAIDLTLLSSAMRSDRAERNRVVAATAAVAGVTALDVYTGTRLSRRHGNGAAGGERRDRADHIDGDLRIPDEPLDHDPHGPVRRSSAGLRHLPERGR